MIGDFSDESCGLQVINCTGTHGSTLIVTVKHVLELHFFPAYMNAMVKIIFGDLTRLFWFHYTPYQFAFLLMAVNNF